MTEIEYLPLNRCHPEFLLPLLEEEGKCWMADLGWDYTPIRRILIDFLHLGILPGIAALAGDRAIAYSYFLTHMARGTIGSIYASSSACSQQVVEAIIDLTAAKIKNSPGVERIEAQVMPFNGVSHREAFIRNDFSHYLRYYMELDLERCRPRKPDSLPGTITRWNSADLSRAAAMLWLSYQDQVDAVISQDYSTKEGCESYLNSVIANPGCGVFMPEASFMAKDNDSHLCGLVVCCRISERAALIPQIAVDSAHQGRGFGNALMSRAFEYLKASGLQSVTLTVTAANRRAFEWYRCLGFDIRKEFGAYTWQRRKLDSFPA